MSTEPYVPPVAHHEDPARNITVWHADALDLLSADTLGYPHRLAYAPPLIPDCSVDSVVTDPPYMIGFMSTSWDRPGSAARGYKDDDHLAGTPRGRDRAADGGDSYGSDGSTRNRAFGTWCDRWMPDVLRVLKPGGFLLAFGSPRTVHRLACAVEDAGFEVRDRMFCATAGGWLPSEIAWNYSTGFPKSLDVSKAIDRAGGASPESQARVLREARRRVCLSRETVAERVGCTAASVRDWEEGRARAVGRAVEFIVPSPQYRDRLADLLGYTADERRITGARIDRRGDGTVIGLGHSGVEYGEPATDAARQWEGWGTALKPAYEPIVVARKPLAGTVAGNVLAHGTGALNIAACQVEAQGRPFIVSHAKDTPGKSTYGSNGPGGGSECAGTTDEGRWPTNLLMVHHPDCGTATCAPGCPVAELDAQSGERPGGGAIKTTRTTTGESGIYGRFAAAVQRPARDDTGGASRFFPVFRYEAKAPAAERPVVGGVRHPTVKPLDLVRWLCRLVTPPGGVVLDLFGGSGTTAEACLLEGFGCVTVERTPEYLPLIMQRLDRRLRPVEAAASAAAGAAVEPDDMLGLIALLGGESA